MAPVRELVEGSVQVGGDPGAGFGEADLELTVAGCLECNKQPLELCLRDHLGVVCAAVPAVLRADSVS